MPGIRRLLVSGFEADRLRNAKITYGTQSVALRRVDDVAAVCRPAGSHVGVEALFFIDVGDGFTQFLQLRLQMLAFFRQGFPDVPVSMTHLRDRAACSAASP